MNHLEGGQHITNRGYDASPSAKFQCDGLTHLQEEHQILKAQKISDDFSQHRRVNLKLPVTPVMSVFIE